MRGGGVQIGKAQASEDTEVIVRWMNVEKKKMRGNVVDGARGSPVEEMCHGV